MPDTVSSSPLPYWWVSYCDTRKPKGQQFVGAVVVRALDVQEAFHAACKVEGVPTEGCLHECHCHHHIDVAFSKVHADQQHRVEGRVGQWWTREEVLALPHETMDEVAERTKDE